MTQCYALGVLDNVNGFEPLTIELWERDILELAMGFVLLDTKLECNSWNCVQIAEYEDFNKTEKKLKFAILSLSRKARYWQILLHFIKLSAAMLHILKKKFEDEIARYIAIKSLEWEGGEIDISVVKLITSWLVNRYFAVSSQQMIAKSIRNLTRHRYW